MNQAHGFRIHSKSGGMAVALRPVRIKVAIEHCKRSRLCGDVSHGNREIGRSSPLWPLVRTRNVFPFAA